MQGQSTKETKIYCIQFNRRFLDCISYLYIKYLVQIHTFDYKKSRTHINQ